MIYVCVLPEHPEFNEGDGEGADVSVHRPQAFHNRRRRRDYSAQ